MPATKTISLSSGGALTLTAADFNPFDADEHERKLVDSMNQALRVYERNARQPVQAEAIGPVFSQPLEQEIGR